MIQEELSRADTPGWIDGAGCGAVKGNEGVATMISSSASFTTACRSSLGYVVWGWPVGVWLWSNAKADVTRQQVTSGDRWGTLRKQHKTLLNI